MAGLVRHSRSFFKEVTITTGKHGSRGRQRLPEEPLERADTLRHQIMDLLGKGERSAQDLSAAVRIPERDVYEHLDHIRKSMERRAGQVVIVPPECRKCGFVFTRMRRLRKPGKCPACLSESIHEPLFRIEPCQGRGK